MTKSDLLIEDQVQTKSDLVKTFYIENPEPLCPDYEELFSYLDSAVRELGNIGIKNIKDVIIQTPCEKGGRIQTAGIERIIIYQKIEKE